MINYQLTMPNAKVPNKKSEDVGYDLYTPVDFVLYSGDLVTINTGFKCELPPDTWAQILGKSKLASMGVCILGGVIDNGYRGEWGVAMINLGANIINFRIGEAIAQFVIHEQYPNQEFILVENLSESQRGEIGIWSGK